MGASVVPGGANNSLYSGSNSEHFQRGSLGKGAQALQQLRQEPEQPLQAGVSLGGCLQWPSAPSFGDRVTLGGLLGRASGRSPGGAGGGIGSPRSGP